MKQSILLFVALICACSTAVIDSQDMLVSKPTNGEEAGATSGATVGGIAGIKAGMQVGGQSVAGQVVTGAQVGGEPMMAGQVGGEPMMAGQVGGEPMMAGQVGGEPMMAGQVGGEAGNMPMMVQINSTPPLDLPPPPSRDLLPTMGNGRVERLNIDGHDDYFIYGPNDYIKLGVRADWGGAIVYWGLDQSGANTIDQNDTGRNVQVALYDATRIRQGCAYNASCLAENQLFCPNSIRYLGWNPVQGGNRCNQGPIGHNMENQERKLIFSTIPYQWNPDWNAANCEQDSCGTNANLEADVRFVQEIRFIDTHIAEIKMVLFNESNDSHLATGQEFPTLYASFGGNQTPDLYRIFNSNLEEIDINEPANDGFFHKSFISDSWASLQNADLTYGVALYYENQRNRFDGWQKKTQPSKFNNIRSEFIFGLEPSGYVIARAYLILGSLQTIAQQSQSLKERLPPFGTIDGPIMGAVVSAFEPLVVAGWVLDNESVGMVEIQINGTMVYQGNDLYPRPEVCSVWVGYQSCPNVGFIQNINISSLAQSPGPHIVDVYATDQRGNRRLIDRQSFMISL